MQRNKSSRSPSNEGSTGEPPSRAVAAAVKAADCDRQQLTSQTTSRDRIEPPISVTVTSQQSRAATAATTTDRSNRPSKAERVLGLTSGAFESAATAARTRRPCDDGGGAPLSPPPPSNVAVGGGGGGFGSPRITSRRRHGVDTTASGPAGKPAQKPSATKTIAALLLMPATAAAASADRKSFPHPATVSLSCRTDLKLFGNYGGGGSDPDLAAAAAGTRGDYGGGGGTSAGVSTPSTAPATVLTGKKPSSSSEHRGRDRFKKILRPVTRSKSAGASERIPAYALFLRHQHDQQKPSTVNRSTDDVMRNSAENTESDSESTDGTSGRKVSGRSKHKKEKPSFFRRVDSHSGPSGSPGSPRHSGPSGPPGSSASSASLPSSETLDGWTKSFEKLLTNKHGLRLFREFLRREFSDENVEFWIECEKFRQMTSEKQRTTEAKKIFREYVAVQSPSEVNLDSKTRETTELNLGRADPKLFDPAQKRIEALMEKDSYPRFLQSETFQRLLRQRQAADNSLRVT